MPRIGEIQSLPCPNCGGFHRCRFVGTDQEGDEIWECLDCGTHLTPE
jgi:phage/plasmid primase-like uncharacterized protein